MTDTKVHHQTERGARIALAKKQISQESYEAVLAGALSLALAKELGGEGAPGARTSRSGSGAGTERPQEGTGAPRSCICGCGETVRGKKSRFRPGHDARLRSELMAQIKKGDVLLRSERITPEQRRYAVERGLAGPEVLPEEERDG